MNKLVYINFISYICSVKGEEPKSLAKEKGESEFKQIQNEKEKNKKILPSNNT